jgi:SAM-dependent methyltransferase
MSQTSSKPFGPIRDAYAFFQQHTTEAEEDVRAYMPYLHGLSPGHKPIRMLDFGCGDGGFSATFLVCAHLPHERLQLALVEPDDAYRYQAIGRLQSFTTQPVCAWPALPPHLQACFDLVLANHVLYYAPDLDGTLSAILRVLATPGLFLVAMAGQKNTLAQLCIRCFTLLGQPNPFHTAEDLEVALARQGVEYSKEDVHYDFIFPDAAENRLTVMRFLLGSTYHDISPHAMLELFDPYARDGQIVMRPVHEHFMVRRHAEDRG